MSTSVKLKFLEKGQELTDEQRFTVAEKLDYVTCLLDTAENFSDIQVITGRIHLGGQSTLFVYEFSVSKSLSLVIKLYNPLKTTLEKLVLHYLSVKEFTRSSRSLTFDRARIKIMPVFALGEIRLPSKKVPFLVQEFSKGVQVSETIASNRYLLELLTDIFKEISKEGFIIDPLPTNWFIASKYCSPAAEQDKFKVKLDYIDILASNRADKEKIRISLENFLGDSF
ncbi:MAG: hypothetical protein ACFFD4_22600 [Candidatus Odinarchaeota archaeon]